MIFDFYKYVEDISANNKLFVENDFEFCKVSGPLGLQDAIAKARHKNNFLAVDDFSDGKVWNNGSAFCTRYVVTIFLFARFDIKRMDDRIDKLAMCRELRSQLHSRFIRDRHSVSAVRYLNVNESLFREFTGAQLNGCTGLYFQLNIDIPTNMCYDEKQWL